MKKKVLGFCLMCLILFGTSVFAQDQTVSGTIRVSLSSAGMPQTVHITVNGSYSIGMQGGIPVVKGAEIEVQNAGGALQLTVAGRVQQQGTRLMLRRHLTSDNLNGLYVREARIPANLIPGDLEMIARDGGIQLIAWLYIEDYLEGVLPYEMDDSFPLEALKAQAVSARTYALRKSALQAPDYDVVDTTADQVYCGTPIGCENCRRAIQDTWGIVGLLGNGFMPAYYTASNGGQTETVSHAWGAKEDADLPMMDDPYDLANPGAETRSAFIYKDGKTSSMELTAILSARAGEADGTIREVLSVSPENPKYGEESHVYNNVSVAVRLNDGREIQLLLDYFKEVEAPCGLSINVLDNETLSVEETEEGFRLTSRRMGHGVGLSQRGAEEMARRGMLCSEILRFYYPGLKLSSYRMLRRILPSQDGSAAVEASAMYADGGLAFVRLDDTLGMLNLLSAPTADAPLVTRVSNGAMVSVLEEYETWSFVQSGTLAGYAENRYLQRAGQIAERTKGNARILLEDAGQTLNVRSAPTMYAQVVGSLRTGDRVTLVTEYEEWSYVRYGETAGFVRNEYIEQIPADESRMNAAAGWQAIVLPSDGADLYADASEQAFIYLHLPQGTTLEAFGEETAGMMRVSLGGLAGYVRNDMLYLSDGANGEAQAMQENGSMPKSEMDVGIVTAKSGLMLRERPNGSAKVKRTIPYGAEVQLLGEENGGYVHVHYEDTEGYAASRYIARTADEAYEEPATVTPEPTASPTVSPTAEPTPVPEASRIVTGQTAVVAAARGLNLRREPSADAELVTLLGSGLRVLVTGEEINGFYPVRIGTLSGYASAAYLRFDGETQEDFQNTEPAPAVEPTDTPAKRVTVTSRNGLHLRAFARADSDSLYILPYGTVLEVLEEAQHGFLHVRWGGYNGYVSSSFVESISAQ